MKIAFHSNQICLRGTEIALYDYAHYNEKILNNESIIVSKSPKVWNYSHPLAINKFSKRFKLYFYENFNEVEKILDDNDVDVFYAIKAGVNDGVVSESRKSVNHIVFQNYEPHGDVYAYVSKWLGDLYNKPFVPHMIDLPNIDDDLRDELSIPKNGIVFGRYGGFETFDISFVHNVIRNIAKNRSDIYFIFLNTNRFTENSLKNVIYLEGSEDVVYKTKFINTCDAMIHARYAGESFGLSIGEFSTKNKPIITLLNGTRDCAHIQMLGNKGIYYNNELELINIFNDFKVDNGKDWNMYGEYNPENIMKIFNNIFLK